MFNDEQKYILSNRFRVVQRSPKHPKVDDRNKEGLYFNIGTIAFLLFLIVLALSYQQKNERIVAPYVPPDFVFAVEDIPETNQQNIPPPPPKMPAVPVESEEVIEELEELVFEIETLAFFDIPPMPKLFDGVTGIAVGPRQIVEKWPEYPESERKKGREGVIEMKILVDSEGNVIQTQIVRNTTGSKVLEKISIDAALGCKFQPALDKNNRPVAAWTSRQYTFKVKE